MTKTRIEPRAASGRIDDTGAPAPSFRTALVTWAKVGLLSFGGPAGQIAVMHRILVDEKRWLGERRFLNALNFCMLLPGPEATQLAIYAGWRLHGLAGGLAAGLLFVLPGAAVMLGLSLFYVLARGLPAFDAVLLGVKAAVLAIVFEALIRIGRRGLREPIHHLIALVAFIAIFFFALPFPLIVMAAGLVGFFAGAPAQTAGGSEAAAVPPPLVATLSTIALWLIAWTAPLAFIAVALGPGHILTQLGVFFSKLAVVTFGGAYAVLAYMAQDVVQAHGWLTAGEMVDALGLAETTPGPLILVTEFVGFLSAHRFGGGLLMGVLGAATVLWATFVPCFLWIFAAAPYIESISAAPRLAAALTAITAAVVGVILNLSVWFAIHVLFAAVTDRRFGPLHVSVPDPASLSLPALLLSLTAVVMLFVLHRGIIAVLAVCAAVSLAWHLLA